jgi:pimeloyl-ACP methyl ester carboxylesterase
MQPSPGLETFARRVSLSRSGLDVFLYDTLSHDGAESGALPWLLVHGLGDEADTWRGLIPALAARGRVLALDLPGFGRSANPAGDCSVPFYQTILLELLDTLGLPRVALAGHSLGAVTAHSLALKAPERVERLVLIAGSLALKSQRVDPARLLFLIPGLGEWLYARLRRDPQKAYRTLDHYYCRIEALPESERAFLFRRVNERVWSDGQRRGFLSALRSLARWFPIQQRGLDYRLAEVQIPTLVIWGAEDRIAPIENAHLLLEKQPSALLVVIPEAGHNVHQEKPEAVLQAMERQLIA